MFLIYHVKGVFELKCPKCLSDKLIKQKDDTTTKVKFRIVTYMEEKTICENCKIISFTPEQLDINNSSLKRAYKNALN